MLKEKNDLMSKSLENENIDSIEMLDNQETKENKETDKNKFQNIKKKKCPSFCEKGNDDQSSSSKLDSQSKLLLIMTIIGVVLGLILGNSKTRQK